MVAGEKHKEEYPNYFFVNNTMPGIDPAAYDATNKNLSKLGANVRIGPSLTILGRINEIGLQSCCGIYMKQADINITPRVSISLDKAIVEMNEVI